VHVALLAREQATCGSLFAGISLQAFNLQAFNPIHAKVSVDFPFEAMPVSPRSNVRFLAEILVSMGL